MKMDERMETVRRVRGEVEALIASEALPDHMRVTVRLRIDRIEVSVWGLYDADAWEPGAAPRPLSNPLTERAWLRPSHHRAFDALAAIGQRWDGIEVRFLTEAQEADLEGPPAVRETLAGWSRRHLLDYVSRQAGRRGALPLGDVLLTRAVLAELRRRNPAVLDTLVLSEGSTSYLREVVAAFDRSSRERHGTGRAGEPRR